MGTEGGGVGKLMEADQQKVEVRRKEGEERYKEVEQKWEWSAKKMGTPEREWDLHFYPCMSPLVSPSLSHTHIAWMSKVFFPHMMSEWTVQLAKAAKARWVCVPLSSDAAVQQKQEHQSPPWYTECCTSLWCVWECVHVCECVFNCKITQQLLWPMSQLARRMIIKWKTFADMFTICSHLWKIVSAINSDYAP